MRAIVVREFGGPEVLRVEEVPDPVAGPGQLLVRVAAAGIQFIETRTRAGLLRDVSPVAPKSLPWIPGREVAGEVVAAGAGVDRDWIGRRVSGQTTGLGGGYAQLALVDFDLLADGGRFVIFGFSDGVMTEIDRDRAAERRIGVRSYFGPPTGPRSPEAQLRLSRTVLSAVTEGRLRTFVGQRFPLDQAAEAHAAIARRGTVGKTVLEP
jgi:NADPH:quinone reductase-like Zn-dependent oxidoreductase